MKEGETMSHIHISFKEILNGLHKIREQVENHDLIKYALKAFIIDAYNVSRDLSNIKLDELFCEFDLI